MSESMRRLHSIMEDFSRSQTEFENLLGQDDLPIDAGGNIEPHQPVQRTPSRAASSREDPDPVEEPFFPDNMPDRRSFEDAECELFGDLDDDDDHHGHGHRSPEGPPVSYQPQGGPEEISVLKLKPMQKSKKGREPNVKFFDDDDDDDEREAFFKSDADQWQKHMDHEAVTVIPPEQAAEVPKHMILPIASRFAR